MLSSFSVFFFMSISLVLDASPTVFPDLAGDMSSKLQERALSSACPSCILPQLRRNSSFSGGQTDMVEAVKRHILNMLHLSTRPNLTQPVPRAALLNAIRKLHVGRVAEDGSVEIPEESQGPGAMPPLEPPSEIITFAEPGDSLNSMTFEISRDGSGSMLVEQANVWIFLKVQRGSRVKAKATLQLLDLEGISISERMVDTRRSGWHTLGISTSVQMLLDSGRKLLHLQVSCPLCDEVGATAVLKSAEVTERAQSHQPFLMVVLRPREAAVQRRIKRGIECDGKTSICCKRQFYVNFKDIGWNDWIIAPAGYHANYCEGECPGHMASIGGSALSFHSTVINQYRLRGYSALQSVRSCCVPTRLRAMSMLYYNEEQKIIKKDVHNMIVEECGCS